MRENEPSELGALRAKTEAAERGLVVAILNAQLLHSDYEQSKIGLTWSQPDDFGSEALRVVFESAQRARAKNEAFHIEDLADQLPAEHRQLDALLLELINERIAYTPISVIDAVTTLKRCKVLSRMLDTLERLATTIASDKVGNLEWLRRRCELDLLKTDDDTRLVLELEKEMRFAHPERWSTADEPMSPRQADYVAQLRAELAYPPLTEYLTKSEAAIAIEELKGEKALRRASAKATSPNAAGDPETNE